MDKQRSVEVGTHVKFSYLVQDETLLMPQLDQSSLNRDPEAIRERFRAQIRDLHHKMTEALGAATTRVEDGVTGGLLGQRTGETFNLDALASKLAGLEPKAVEQGEALEDFMVRTIEQGTEAIPDQHFVNFLEKLTFYGKSHTQGYEAFNNRISEVRTEMRDLRDGIEVARERGDVEEAARLERIFASMQAGIRSDEPASNTQSDTAPKGREVDAEQIA